MADEPTQEELDEFNDQVQILADREGISFEEASRNFGDLLDAHFRDPIGTRFWCIEQRLTDLEKLVGGGS